MKVHGSTCSTKFIIFSESTKETFCVLRVVSFEQTFDESHSSDHYAKSKIMTQDLWPHHRRNKPRQLLLQFKKPAILNLAEVFFTYIQIQKNVQQFVLLLFFSTFYNYQNAFVQLNILIEKNRNMFSIFLSLFEVNFFLFCKIFGLLALINNLETTPSVMKLLASWYCKSRLINFENN